MTQTGPNPGRRGLRALCSLLLGAAGLASSGALLSCGAEEEYVPYLSQTDLGQTLEINGKAITVEAAINDSQRRQGLQQRPSLPPDHGMLFVYPKPDHLRFWMKETYLDLDIAFLKVEWGEELTSGTATVVNIEQMGRHEEVPGAISHEPVTMALEMSKGWFQANGVTTGSVIELPEWVADLRVE